MKKRLALPQSRHVQDITLLSQKLDGLLATHRVAAMSVAFNTTLGANNTPTSIVVGVADKDTHTAMTTDTAVQIASLSKTVSTAFAIDFLARHSIGLNTPVNQILRDYDANVILRPKDGVPEAYAEEITIRHLMNHTGLGMHYVHGFSSDKAMPSIEALLTTPSDHLCSNGHYYEAIQVEKEPGKQFSYSGGGYLFLQYLIELIDATDHGQKRPIEIITQPFLEALGMTHFTFSPKGRGDIPYAKSYNDEGLATPRLMFPSFAAGCTSTTTDMAHFLSHLTAAYQPGVSSSGGIAHNTAVDMLHGTPVLGSMAFMHSHPGVGTFICDAGDNKLMIHQGANEGARCFYAQCFKGPDVGKGFMLSSTGDENAMAMNCEASLLLLKSLGISGIQFPSEEEPLLPSIDTLTGVPQEQRVNQGLKEIVLNRFTPFLAPTNLAKGDPDPFSAYNKSRNATCIDSDLARQGFTGPENLVKTTYPVSYEGQFLERSIMGHTIQVGVLYDSWETPRHGQEDYAIFRLETPSPCRYVLLTTTYHKGNHAETATLYARASEADDWIEILPQSQLNGHSEHRFTLKEPHASQTWQDIKVIMAPDGGLTRLWLYDTDSPDDVQHLFPKQGQPGITQAAPQQLPPAQHLEQGFDPGYPSASDVLTTWQTLRPGDTINICDRHYGTRITSVSDQRYTPPDNLLSPEPPRSIMDGFETARNRDPLHRDWATITLPIPVQLSTIALDCTPFLYNTPNYVKITGNTVEGASVTVLPRTYMKPYSANTFESRAPETPPLQHIRLIMEPDGGISRIASKVTLTDAHIRTAISKYQLHATKKEASD